MYNSELGYASNGYLIYTDENGKPLTGGSISTFIAGTTTPIITYKDFNGGQNPHKITLDENGGATIILRQDTVYKFIIRDRNGDIFKTIDNIVTAGTTTVVEGEDVTVEGTEDEIDVSFDNNVYNISLADDIKQKIEGGGGGTSDVEIVRYNVTSYLDIATAHSNGKIVILIYQSGSSVLIATLSRIDSSAIEFRYVNDVGRISTFEVNQFDVWTTSIYTPSSASYTLPTASATVLGGIKVGSGLEIINGVLQLKGFEVFVSYGEEQNVEYLEVEALEPSLRIF